MYIKSGLPIGRKFVSQMVNDYASKVKHLSSTFTSFDKFVLNNWKLVNIPFKGTLIGKLSTKQLRSGIKWHPPYSLFIKLNFDGAVKGNWGRSRAGFILRKADKSIPQPTYCRISNVL